MKRWLKWVIGIIIVVAIVIGIYFLVGNNTYMSPPPLPG